MTCCGTIETIGCIDHCDAIIIPTNDSATIAGDYILSLVGGHRFSQTFAAGAALRFTVRINEDKENVLQVIDPNGQLVSSITGNSCFKYKVKQQITI